MGITQSTESALTAVVLASVLGLGCHYYYTTSSRDGVEENNAATASTDAKSVKKSKKRKKNGSEASSSVAPTSTSASAGLQLVGTIPGQFDQQQVQPVPPTANPKTKKPKKKASAAKPVPSSSSLQPPPARTSDTARDASSDNKTGESWTRVVSRRRQGGGAADGHESIIDVTTSDAGLTSSVTGNSSPIEKEEEVEAQSEEGKGKGKGKEDSTIGQLELQTLAEKLVPKNPQTTVDDMLPDHNQATLSRVMRIQPLPDEKPLPGFSWKDYEDVDADGEDDGWGVVKSKRTRPSGASASTSTSASISTTLKPASSQQPAQTQKQRQNAKKREAQKAAKAASEAERLAMLAKHKRELEKARIIEQSRSGGKTGGKVSGGMAPVVDSAGKLVWE